MTSDRDPQLLKGVLPMLTLAALTRDESYGYELVAALRAAGLAELSTGTLYPVLTRLERDGLVTSRLVASSSGPARKYYRPSDAGLAALRTISMMRGSSRAAESSWTIATIRSNSKRHCLSSPRSFAAKP